MEGAAIHYGLAPQRCAVCATTFRLLICSSCNVVSYCSIAHQSTHRARHKAACVAIRKSREALEREEAALRARPTEAFVLPTDVFNTCVGRFWSVLSTRDYMRARFAAANALLEIDTVRAVEAALGHFRDMLRLCRSDNLGVRDIIPSLLLRLGQEQECYDFIKWWATVDENYDWHDNTSPYLDIHGADAFENVDLFCSKNMSLSHRVALVLLKLRLRLDLMPFEDLDSMLEYGKSEFDRPVGTLVLKRLENIDFSAVSVIVEALEQQYRKLCRIVYDKNPYFWEALADETEEELVLPSYYSPGSEEEATLTLHQSKRAWEETEDAILMIGSETSTFTSVYTGPDAAATASSARMTLPTETTNGVMGRRGTGLAFPTTFKPPLPMPEAIELFSSITSGRSRTHRLIYRFDQGKALLYTDGACSNNGRQGAQAGWAVLYGQTDGFWGENRFIASGRLDSIGCYVGENKVTSNRAELRAVIAALRLRDWQGEGLSSVVIATDSSYVVDGATGWVKGWLRNGWKKHTGDNVKNRDLWEQLLGEVERWKDSGLDVELWKIPRELNNVADAAAKNAARPRILVLCLEHERLFKDCFAKLVSNISSKAILEMATTGEKALDILNQEQPPSIILVADGALTRQKKIWERVIDRLRDGTTVILAGCFSSMVDGGQFDRFFAKLGLPWKRGSYYRTTAKLRRGVVGGHLENMLPSAYSQKALFVKNVEKQAVWYASEDSSEAAVVLAGIGCGKLGYIGDVNGEESSDAVVMAMCSLLD